jgi:hypothetical protein
MNKTVVIFSMAGLLSILLMTCGKDSSNNPGPLGQDTTHIGPLPLDLSVVGKWEGVMAQIGSFNGAKIFVEIAKTDSAFRLVSLDPKRNPALNPAILDTSLVLTGKWRLNTVKDSILLLCDQSRIIDTSLNILRPNDVSGQIVPMLISISKDQTSGDIGWLIALQDLVPLSPMLGIDLTGVNVTVLQVIKILLVKKLQL